MEAMDQIRPISRGPWSIPRPASSSARLVNFLVPNQDCTDAVNTANGLRAGAARKCREAQRKKFERDAAAAAAAAAWVAVAAFVGAAAAAAATFFGFVVAAILLGLAFVALIAAIVETTHGWTTTNYPAYYANSTVLLGSSKNTRFLSA